MYFSKHRRVLDCYHIVLNVCQMNRALREYFSGFYFSESFLGLSEFCQGQSIFWGHSEIPIPLIPVRRNAKSTPGTLLHSF